MPQNPSVGVFLCGSTFRDEGITLLVLAVLLLVVMLIGKFPNADEPSGGSRCRRRCRLTTGRDGRRAAAGAGALGKDSQEQGQASIASLGGRT